ncbi:MAG: FMN-binding protein, partial [Sinomicrobium sp.]|nr:FMN-binding protein [Sinomicrobium sp.]
VKLRHNFRFKLLWLRGLCAVVIAAAGYLAVYPLALLQCVLPSQLKGGWGADIGIQSAYAEMVSTIDEVIRQVFPKADSIESTVHRLDFKMLFSLQKESGIEVDPAFDSQYRFFTVAQNGQTLGYAAEHTVLGKWGPIHYLLSIKPDGTIADVSVLDYQERRGRPISKSRFTRQFIGKSIADPLKVQTDIKGVTGASISSKGITDGIRKTLHVFNALYTDR